MVKKIIVIFLLFVIIVSNFIALIFTFQTISRTFELKEYYKQLSRKEYESGPLDMKELYVNQFEELRATYISDISTILFCSALIPLCAFAIYELIRSIRHPMRYAVEGAQQSYADYKEWREKVRAEREAAAKEARRAELERELAELKKTE